MQYYAVYQVYFGRKTLPVGVVAVENIDEGEWVRDRYTKDFTGTLYRHEYRELILDKWNQLYTHGEMIQPPPAKGHLVYEIYRKPNTGEQVVSTYFLTGDGKRTNFGWGTQKLGEDPIPEDVFFDEVPEDDLPDWVTKHLATRRVVKQYRERLGAPTTRGDFVGEHDMTPLDFEIREGIDTAIKKTVDFLEYFEVEAQNGSRVWYRSRTPEQVMGEENIRRYFLLEGYTEGEKEQIYMAIQEGLEDEEEEEMDLPNLREILEESRNSIASMVQEQINDWGRQQFEWEVERGNPIEDWPGFETIDMDEVIGDIIIDAVPSMEDIHFHYQENARIVEFISTRTGESYIVSVGLPYLGEIGDGQYGRYIFGGRNIVSYYDVYIEQGTWTWEEIMESF